MHIALPSERRTKPVYDLIRAFDYSESSSLSLTLFSVFFTPDAELKAGYPPGV